jgi:DNA polymerase-1
LTANLPGFDRIVAIDTEYTPVVGGHVRPICLVAHELVSGQRVRLWHDELGPIPPFPTDDRTLYVCYMAAAESGFFLARGWPTPARVLDLFAEFRNHTNKALPKSLGGQQAGLIDALEYFGIRETHGYTVAEKKAMQDLACRGGPYTEQQKWDFLDYCEADVEVLGPLMERLLLHIRARRKAPGAPRRGLVQALHRGRYMNAVASMEYTGPPVDIDTYRWVNEHRLEVMEYLIERGDREYGVFEGTTFKQGLFRKYLAEQGLLATWPRTDKRGHLSTDQNVVKDQARAHPQLENLRQMLLLRGTLQDFKLAVGEDGRNRTGLRPFATATGRNAPSNGEFIFGPSVWWRGLIKPPEGRAIAYVDYSAQEIAIAAALSGDPELVKAVESSDPYLAFAVRAGLAPDGATKASHPRIRNICKVALLGMNYGMGVRSLAAGTDLSYVQAEALHRQLKKVYDRFQQWSRCVVNTGLLRRELSTYFGWRVSVVEGTKTTTLQNYPAQAHGSEMLRLACCLVVEDGIELCCPIHDAVLIEAGVDEIDAAVARTRQLMVEASRVVLGGFEVKTDADIFRYPDRYSDPRGEDMWQLMMELKNSGTTGTSEPTPRTYGPTC